MGSDRIRNKFIDVGKKRAEAEKKLAEARAQQANKAAAAASYRARAAKTSSASMAKSYLRSAEAAEKVALAEGQKAAASSRRVADCSKQEAGLNKELATSLQHEAADEARARKRREDAARRAGERQRREDHARVDALLASSEDRLSQQIAAVRPPKPERLRILYLTAAARGDLRMDKEIRRVEAGVQAATLRDLVQIKPMPAATPSDLLDGLARFRPHVVHFSGHAGTEVLEFDTDANTDNPGQIVTADAFARAMAAVDVPPLLVVLNACKSEGHLDRLLAVVPLAIGMADNVGDQDAMAFAARFYTAVAEGQSVQSAWAAARVQMEFDGLPDADLPVLKSQAGVHPDEVMLVIPPE